MANDDTNSSANSDINSSKLEHRFGIGVGSVAEQDLNRLLVSRPETTFYMEMSIDQAELNLFRGDILIVDRSLKPHRGSLVVSVDDEYFRANRYAEATDIWGVVVYVIHKVRK